MLEIYEEIILVKVDRNKIYPRDSPIVAVAAPLTNRTYSQTTLTTIYLLTNNTYQYCLFKKTSHERLQIEQKHLLVQTKLKRFTDSDNSGK